ncbi:Acyl carrier protein [bacterium HR30]|nr:Acyl carrier protein [bacterium HR30]
MSGQLALTPETVRRRVASVLHEVAGIPLEQITDDASFDTTLAIESVQLVELQVALEEEFQTELDPLYMIELNRFGDIVEYIYRRARGEEVP